MRKGVYVYTTSHHHQAHDSTVCSTVKWGYWLCKTKTEFQNDRNENGVDNETTLKGGQTLLTQCKEVKRDV